ncbi:MAG TPA: hypothetical protein VH351_23470 [Bryobacteraceae bacterium]|jgi:hypothetical protein|nr:hypothetical protein [Bryobacteraceae bacterium]
MNRILLLMVFASCTASAQSFLTELRAEPNMARRAEKALQLANSAFEGAHELYDKGRVHEGDAQLDDMTAALNECVQSLEQIHKPALYKKAELNVATLQRKMNGLLDDIALQERGWAEYTSRKLEGIHDKLLEGVMRK